MNPSKNGPKVALLIDDSVETKKLSSIFKRMGFNPICFEDLEVFWSRVEEENPSLCIIDVTMMSKGTVILKDHPLVKEDNLPLAFYYSDETTPLVISTYDIFHMGLIKKSENYGPSLKCALKRAVKYWSLKGKNQKTNTRLQESIKRTISDSQTRINIKVIKSWLAAKGHKDFFSACEHVFSNWPEIEKYTWVTLNSCGQKLISPQISAFKFQKIPEINLGKNLIEGLDQLAEDMAQKVVTDSFGEDYKVLKIKGNKKHPEVLVFLNIHPSLNKFDWHMLEEFLSIFYLSAKAKENFFESQKKLMIEPWELFNLLDENIEAHGKKITLIDLDFSSQITALIGPSKNRFYWNKFLNDFCNPLEKEFEFNVSCVCPGHLVFLADWKIGNSLFEHLLEKIKDFPFYKYFAGQKEVLSGDYSPQLKMIPPSVRGYLSHLSENSPFFRENSISRSDL